MNLANQAAKMVEALRPIAERKRRRIRSRRLAGATWEQVCDAVESAVSPEDGPILDQIVKQLQEYESQPPRRYKNYRGEEIADYKVHGFRRWLRTIREGTSTLPDKLPRSFLLAWRDGYVSVEDGKRTPWEPSPWSPQPGWRCAECQLVLPGACYRWDETGCPVCGSREMQFWDLSVAPAVIRFLPANRSSAAAG